MKMTFRTSRALTLRLHRLRRLTRACFAVIRDYSIINYFYNLLPREARNDQFNIP